MKAGGEVQGAPGDSFNQRVLAESARHTGEKVLISITAERKSINVLYFQWLYCLHVYLLTFYS